MSSNVLVPGQALYRGQSLYSNDGRASFIMQHDGNAVLYLFDGRSPWGSSSDGTDATHIVMQEDGNLVVYNEGGHPYWDSGTWGNPGAYFILQDDGNGVVYNNQGQWLWDTATDLLKPLPSYNQGGGNRLYAEQGLGHETQLVSPRGRYNLTFQADGNLVLYSNDRRILWSPNTYNKGCRFAKMQQDGNFVIYDNYANAKWASNTAGNPGAYLELQDGGNLCLFRADGHLLWSTKTQELEYLDNDTIRFTREVPYDGDIFGGGFSANIVITMHRDGRVKFVTTARKSGIQDYKFGISAIIGGHTMKLAYQKSGSVAGSYFGTKYKTYEEEHQYPAVAAYFDDFKDNAILQTATQYKGTIQSYAEGLIKFIINMNVGTILGPFMPVLVVGTELISLFSTGSLIPGARVINGMLWLRGPEGIMYAVIAGTLADLGSNTRDITQAEYDYANNHVFKGKLPPKDIIKISDSSGMGGAKFVFPDADGRIIMNMGKNLYQNPLSSAALFMHEMTHVAQCHAWGHLTYSNKTSWIQVKQFLEGGQYHYDQSLPDHVPFTDYNPEQQAEIVQDWVTLLISKGMDENHPDVIGSRAYRFIANNVRLGHY